MALPHGAVGSSAIVFNCCLLSQCDMVTNVHVLVSQKHIPVGTGLDKQNFLA